MAAAVAMEGKSILDKKVVSISTKRQITIPQKFFVALGFADEAECMVRGNELVIRPVKPTSGGEFAEQILTELIAEGREGTDLLEEFKKRQAKVRPAVEEMIADCESAALGKGEYFTYDDVFGAEDDE